MFRRDACGRQHRDDSLVDTAPIFGRMPVVDDREHCGSARFCTRRACYNAMLRERDSSRRQQNLAKDENSDFFPNSAKIGDR